MDEHSRTAVLAAVARGMHTEMSDTPLLDDSLAAKLYTDEEKERITTIGLKTGLSEEQQQQLGESYSLHEAWELAYRHGAFAAASVARNRYAEDCLEIALRDRGIDQYVIVGAGLETFAWRRPELTEQVTIFELDHPGSQAFKRERLAAAALSIPESLHFVPVDLETDSIPSALAGTAYASDRPAFYSWLGVILYLSTDAIFGTLQSIAENSAPGSELVFDFIDTEGTNPDATTPRIRRFMRMVEGMGEPIGPGLELSTLEDELNQLGFELIELLSPDEQRQRYFDDQPDYFGPTEHYHFAHVRVA